MNQESGQDQDDRHESAQPGAGQDEDVAIALQEQVGLKVVNDGEFRRGSYWLHFVQKTAGFGTRHRDG